MYNNKIKISITKLDYLLIKALSANSTFPIKSIIDLLRLLRIYFKDHMISSMLGISMRTLYRLLSGEFDKTKYYTIYSKLNDATKLLLLSDSYYHFISDLKESNLYGK